MIIHQHIWTTAQRTACGGLLDDGRWMSEMACAAARLCFYSKTIQESFHDHNCATGRPHQHWFKNLTALTQGGKQTKCNRKSKQQLHRRALCHPLCVFAQCSSRAGKQTTTSSYSARKMALLNAMALLFMLLAGAASAAGVAQAPGAAQQSPYGEQMVVGWWWCVSSSVCPEPLVVIVSRFALGCCANGLLHQLACVCAPPGGW